MDIISLLVFVALIILAFTRKVNLGVLAFGAALVLSSIMGIPGKEVVRSMSSSLFVTLAGITLLFAAVNSTGALEMIAHKLVSVAKNKVWILPIIAYLSGFVLSVIGPGAIPPTTLVVTMAITVGMAAGYNAVMMGLIGGLGLMGGRVSTITPEGNLVANLAAEQGISGDIIPLVLAFQLISTALFAFFVFLYYKGYKVKASTLDIKLGEEKKFNKKQIVALLTIVLMLFFVVVFHTDTGLTSFLLAGILFLFNIADDSTSIKSIPWNTIIMILGVGVLMGVIDKAGGIELLTNALSRVMTPATVAPFMGLTAGIMSLVSSGLGVVYPTLIPLASNLVQTVGGGSPVAVIAAVVAGGSFAGFSPISTCGALTLGTMVTLQPNMTKAEQNKAFIELFVIAILSVVWVGISSFIFASIIGY